MMCAAVATLAGLAWGHDGQPNDGWRAEWLRARNALIESKRDIDVDPTSVLVRFKPGVDDAVIQAVKLAAGVRVEPIATWDLVPGLEHLMVTEGTAEDAIRKLTMLPMVEYAEFDDIVRIGVTPNDTNYSLLWGMNNTGQTVNGDPGVSGADINAPQAWDITTGSASLVIADIDTGVNYNHPDLAGNSWINPGETAGNGIDDDGNGYVDDTRGWDFYSNDNNPIDDNGHGTHTAGTFGAVGNNGVGVTGVAWQCKIMALKFLGASGSGSTSGAISCLNYAVGKGVKVSNNSWGGGGYNQALFDAINNSRGIGHVFVAAAGNAGLNTDLSANYPSGYNIDNIISVASSTNDDARSSFSNFGATTVDLAAPGSTILSTYGSGYAYLDGTSMATPHVTGVVALVQGRHPDWTYAQVRQRILATTRPVAAFSGITVTGGVLDAFAAVNDGAPVNNPPGVTMTSPTNGQVFGLGAVITFTGSATDTEDGNLTANLAWTSSIDGAIGTGGSFSRSLSAGAHVITASVTDSGGRSTSSAVSISVQAPPPGNNACGAAVVLTNNVAVAGTTVNATVDGTATCGAAGSSPDVWYRYTATGTTALQIDTCGSALDTVLTVFTGSCGALTQIACNDDNGNAGTCPGGLTSYVTFTPTANTTYYIRVAGYNGATGTFNVRASGGQAPPPPVTRPAAPTNLSHTRVNGVSIISWQDNSNNETRFGIQRQVFDRYWRPVVVSSVSANVTSQENAIPPGRYRWRVRAENAAGNSVYTPFLEVIIP